jgi:hypothetical protein
MSANCPVCSSVLKTSATHADNRDAYAYQCIQCGCFMLSGSLVASLGDLFNKNADSGAILSHAIRQAQTENHIPLFTTVTVETILKQSLPRPREQADLLLRWLAKNIQGPGETVSIAYATHGSIIGSKSPAGFELVVDHLFAKGLITGNHAKFISGDYQAEATLSFEGWEYYENLRAGNATYRKAFMAMKFGDSDLNKILNEFFRPAAKRAGFDLFKLDDTPKAGLIDDRLRVEIQSADFIVADLTHDNLGAYWEAGYAEGLGKPVIYTCEKKRFQTAKTHFDTNHHLTILWDIAAPETAGIDLTATIRATLPHIATLTDKT